MLNKVLYGASYDIKTQQNGLNIISLYIGLLGKEDTRLPRRELFSATYLMGSETEPEITRFGSVFLEEDDKALYSPFSKVYYNFDEDGDLFSPDEINDLNLCSFVRILSRQIGLPLLFRKAENQGDDSGYTIFDIVELKGLGNLAGNRSSYVLNELNSAWGLGIVSKNYSLPKKQVQASLFSFC